MELNEEKAREWWMEELNGELDEARRSQLVRFLEGHPDLKAGLEEETVLWDQLGELPQPEPSPSMDAAFQAMLEGYRAAGQEKQPSLWLGAVTAWLHSRWQLAAGFMVVGLVIGFFLSRPLQKNAELDRLSSDISEMKQMMMLTLIEQPMAKDRIKAVNMAESFKQPDQAVIEALITSLNKDSNVNVRLAALEVLATYGEQPRVREALVRAIPGQESPLVLVALADVMTRLAEKSSVGEFEHVLDEQELDELVRTKLDETIKTLKKI